MNRNPFLLYVLVLLTGCASSEDFINFTQGPDFTPTPEDIANYRTVRIQPDDILHIQVFSIDPVAAQPFNTVNMAAGANANREALQLSGYLVDKEGMIDFPIIGRLKVSGLGIIEAKETIHKALEVYLKEPVVNIRLLNFRVNVLGEVAQSRHFLHSLTTASRLLKPLRSLVTSPFSDGEIASSSFAKTMVNANMATWT